MICLILIISFLLESIFTNIINLDSIFIPLFVITSLTLVYPLLKKKIVNYIIICLILGFLYDVSFSNSSFLNLLCFCILGIITIIYYNYVNYNIYTATIINIIVIIVYRIISYIILLSINYLSFDFLFFLSGIYNSLLINIIYGIIIYMIIKKYSKKE